MSLKRGATNPTRLRVWGDSLLNKLKGKSRKRRKREASKKRRAVLKYEAESMRGS